MTKKKTDVPRETLQLVAAGASLNTARKKNDMTIIDVSGKSDVSTLTIAKVEKGELENTSLKTLNKIAKAVGKKIELKIVDL